MSVAVCNIVTFRSSKERHRRLINWQDQQQLSLASPISFHVPLVAHSQPISLFRIIVGGGTCGGVMCL
jgi:hypothetical protein